jgi:ribosomal protein S18 acetylase RimI-like enzyme
MSTPDPRRIEELSLNSSAPPGQLLYDGWIVRLAPGKAKRARSVNAFFPSARPLEDKIAYCQALYDQAGLPLLFRMTPFCQPQGLDGELERRGFARFETTSVRWAPIPATMAAVRFLDPWDLEPWVDAVARLRGSPVAQRDSHLARLQGLPLAKRAFALEEGGEVVATGLAVAEGDWAGLFDIVTHPQARRRGHGRRIVATLLDAARLLGARHAYLQVEAGNAGAIALYDSFGFAERYTYGYRGREGPG